MTSRPTRATAGLLASLLAAATLLVAAPAAQADQIRDSEYWLKDYGIKQAWKVSKGEDVTVAVIDTGIADSHPDLSGTVIGGSDFSAAGNKDGTEPLGALPEHGTLVGTLLAGHGNNEKAIAKAKAEDEKQTIAWKRAVKDAKKDDEDPPKKPDPVKIPKPGPGPDGVIGVAPKAELLSGSLWLGSENPGGVPISEQVPRAVKWAVDQGADVINMSLGSTTPSWPTSWDEAFKYAEEHDVVIVAAAGNRAGGMEQVGAPATIPGVLTVAGVDKKGKASWDSSTQGISIGVAAPADPLVGGLPDGGYADWSGTSGAAPLVSGVAALIRSKYPEMKARDVIQRILATAEDAGEPGVDNLYGYGLLDAEAALTTDVPSVDQNPLGTIAEWIHVHRRGQVTRPNASKPSAKPEEESSVPAVAAPEAVAPEDPAGALPAVLVIGFGALALIIIVGGGVHVVTVRRRNRAALAAAAGTVADAEWTASEADRDPFDDLPESR
ncbi:S8 family serine peptidase [Arthrobacter sp. AOP36-A1-22]|uniref:S8 family serine peptidase n=1 Tax=unclassified Arthrobacter TaxID=235627 RepID=UPI00264C0989|nr:S8 family serine peptidase [Micrococcaceae bacterium]